MYADFFVFLDKHLLEFCVSLAESGEDKNSFSQLIEKWSKHNLKSIFMQKMIGDR